ncbi:hypothetical protein [Hymenobacter glacialis]|uniref:hypothetical protein n=1 Tax=Hymenobacter glacialis TaxID=1908236 RepID=UPI000F7A13C4|nr:hypothetical protein [Hymenobacter glacialis]
MMNEMWVIILLFIYSIVNKLDFPIASAEQRRDNYLEARYLNFRRLYGKIIDKELDNDILKSVAYSIIIHENFNRSVIVRKIENIAFFLTKRPHSLGVMQFPTNEYITDRQSVEFGTRKVRHTYELMLRGELS